MSKICHNGAKLSPILPAANIMRREERTHNADVRMYDKSATTRGKGGGGRSVVHTWDADDVMWDTAARQAHACSGINILASACFLQLLEGMIVVLPLSPLVLNLGAVTAESSFSPRISVSRRFLLATRYFSQRSGTTDVHLVVTLKTGYPPTLVKSYMCATLPW